VSEEAPGVRDPRLVGVAHRVVTHEPAGSLKEAARMRGVQPEAVIKTMVVRKSEDDYVFVLVPGNRLIDWPKLRSHLGERRLSLPEPEEAIEATGYAPGTITPLGANTAWPVVADKHLTSGEVSIGAGKGGWSITISAPALLELLDAEIADVTRSAS